MNATLRSQPVKALIFDMDDTIVDSMPFHASTWLDFAKKHGLSLDIDDMMRRTTGRTGVECVRQLMDQPDMPEALAWKLVHEKEQLYRDLFGPIFKEVTGFGTFYKAVRAQGSKWPCRGHPERGVCAKAPAVDSTTRCDCAGRRRPDRQAHPRHLSGGRPAHGGSPLGVHRFRGRTVWHRGSAPRRHARGGGVHRTQPTGTGWQPCGRGGARFHRVDGYAVLGFEN